MADNLAFSRKELGRAKDIVASLLGLSRQTGEYTEAVDLKAVAKDALRVLYNRYKRYEVNIEEDYAAGLPAIQGNFAQLGQVCLNVIQNAIEAIGKVKGKITLRTYGEDGWVVFACVDTGPGMSAEVRRDIFKPFFTTRAPGEGTGLGLYIVHQIVEKHGGRIEVDSEVGKGTTFRVRLPLKPRSAP
jgi:two-component system NtrC family sensor kinase